MVPRARTCARDVERAHGPRGAVWMGACELDGGACGRAASTSDGVKPFYVSGDAGNEQASFDKEASLEGPQIAVPAVRLDSLFLSGEMEHVWGKAKVGEEGTGKMVDVDVFGPVREFGGVLKSSRVGNTLNVSEVRIFLLKIDAEGYDADVLRGAERLLRTPRLVKFLIFEYNAKWFTAGRTETLRAIVQMLDEWDYRCFWVTPLALVPLWGRWWSTWYEVRAWSNVICVEGSDEEAKWFVREYNRADVPGWTDG
ncbi:hypothetical protein M427DRAFT_176058 [Gonapodya prolifera JEL478]|uniref:Methyltransferase FkbM domain-containing protein n=1 Tax=Gonapodya prolifera (strain JEL478) TaxID=1344416 RepID=A0A139APX1_GONPJ|nr:hypothetical protein M427DRAFT_176058 [Gonapodya prolifera JEL478]|eukprot:KXS18786.1 hypothetical protein M427DRAFT_176058 [Gonapodya prolifera JEL478]